MQIRIDPFAVERARQKAVLQTEHRDQRLCDPRSTERVSGPALCRTAGSCAPEDAGDGLVFHGIVGPGRRAMQIDLVDIRRL